MDPERLHRRTVTELFILDCDQHEAWCGFAGRSRTIPLVDLRAFRMATETEAERISEYSNIQHNRRSDVGYLVVLRVQGR
jgi:hypothetical protein